MRTTEREPVEKKWGELLTDKTANTQTSSPEWAMQRPMTREVAELFLAAFDNDSIGTWCNALRAWEEIGAPDGEGDDLGRAVKCLRQAWWHEGSPEKRKAVKDAARELQRGGDPMTNSERKPECVWCHKKQCDCLVIVCYDFTRKNPPMILRPQKEKP